MSQSLARVAIHIVYSTKHRRTWLQDKELRAELNAYTATILRNTVDSPAIIVNGADDHIHALCLLSRKFAIMKVIEKAKTETSKWIKQRKKELNGFAWQSGYGAFSVSELSIPHTRKYVEDQERHHTKMTYQDELRILCKRHGLELNEQYAWD